MDTVALILIIVSLHSPALGSILVVNCNGQAPVTSVAPLSANNELKPCPSPFRMKPAAGLQERYIRLHVEKGRPVNKGLYHVSLMGNMRSYLRACGMDGYVERSKIKPNNYLTIKVCFSAVSSSTYKMLLVRGLRNI